MYIVICGQTAQNHSRNCIVLNVNCCLHSHIDNSTVDGLKNFNHTEVRL